jgi:hypothetical protein
VKFLVGQMLDQLRKHGAARVHPALLPLPPPPPSAINFLSDIGDVAINMRGLTMGWSALAEAVDKVIARSRHAENRRRLEKATAAYFDNLSSQVLTEENALAGAMHDAVKGIDFDREP